MTWRACHIALLLLHAFVGIAVNGTSDPSVFSVSTFQDGGFPSDFLSGDGEVGNINDEGTYLTDISPAEAIQLSLAKADLHSLASDLNETVEEEVEALEGDILSSIDDFQERLENATQRLASNLQCKFSRRFEQSDQIMTKIFLLSTFEIEIIKAELRNNISIVPIDFENATTSPPTTTIQPEDLPKDCAEALDMELPSGVTTIRPAPNRDIQRVWCDQETDGGGWTVMLRREPRPIQLDFRQNWDSYVEGFGDPRTEYWIGLETLHQLTKRKPYMLRVDMDTEEDGEEAFSIYNTFRVAAASREYKLRVGDYNNESSTGGEALIYHNGQKFSTYDEDNDGASGGNCADWSGGGGWWYDYCFKTNPTSIYPPLNATIGTDMYLEWREWRGFYFYLSHLVMMIRPGP